MNAQIVSILREEDQENVQKYFDDFLVFFHSDDEEYTNIVPTREYIRTVEDIYLEREAHRTAYFIIIHKTQRRDKKIILFLADKIYRYFLSYRTEHRARIHTSINDILG